MQPTPTTQAEAVIYYIQEMDMDMIDLILDNDRTYQHMPKSDFIEKLTNAMENFKQHKNDKLIGYAGFCDTEKCVHHCKNGYSFIGNHSKHRMDIIFEVTNGNVQDLHECEEFKAIDKNIDVKEYSRIYIDEPRDGLVSGIESFF